MVQNQNGGTSVPSVQRPQAVNNNIWNAFEAAGAVYTDYAEAPAGPLLGKGLTMALPVQGSQSFMASSLVPR